MKYAERYTIMYSKEFRIDDEKVFLIEVIVNERLKKDHYIRLSVKYLNYNMLNYIGYVPISIIQRILIDVFIFKQKFNKTIYLNHILHLISSKSIRNPSSSMIHLEHSPSASTLKVNLNCISFQLNNELITIDLSPQRIYHLFEVCLLTQFYFEDISLYPFEFELYPTTFCSKQCRHTEYVTSIVFVGMHNETSFIEEIPVNQMLSFIKKAEYKVSLEKILGKEIIQCRFSTPTNDNQSFITVKLDMYKWLKMSSIYKYLFAELRIQDHEL